MQHKIAVVIINWNNYLHSRNCIRSLNDSSINDFDIILLDNASVDGSGEKLKDEFNDIVFLKTASNLGFTGGNNIGIQYALDNQYEFILMLNNDVFVDQNFIYNLKNYLDFHLDVGAVQPLIYQHPERTKVWNGGGFFNRFLAKSYSNRTFNGSIGPKEINWITGCAFMVRASVFRETGLLNEKYFAYHEDVDLSFKIRGAGYKLVFIPQAVIYHIGGGSSNSSEKLKEGYQNPDVHYYNARNQIWIIRTWLEWYEKPIAILYHALYSVSLAAYFLIRMRWNKLKAVVKGFIHGFTINYT
jgi:GT2 family glycosyltransferase